MSRQWVAWSGLALLCAAVVALVPAVDVAALRSTWRAAAADPAGLAVALALYLAAFVGRAALMSRTLPSVPLRHSLAALHVALAGNKLLPLRLGEALRITSVVRRTGVSVAEATASTVLLRGADVLAVVLLAAVLGPQALAGSLGAVVWVVAVPAAALVVAGVWWVRRLGGRVPGPTVAVGAVAAWILESGVVWQAARWAGIALSPADAVLVTAVVTVAQVAAVAPGGLGTYEAAATGALVALGAPAGPALAAALTAHAVNTAYALAAGAVAVAVPAPGLLGRWRLPRAPAAPDPAVAAGRWPDPAPASGHALLPPPALNKQASVGQAVRPAAPDPAGGHVLLFLPALDEEASAGHVVRPATPAAPDPASGHALLPPPALDEEASAGHVVGPAAPDPAGGHVLLFLPALDEEASVGHVVRPATPAAPDPAGGHVLLFLPALDEEASVGQVVRRVPATVCGRPVRCLVIDDGSTDQTAGAAAAAGARVLSLGANQGLGAAVRHGLAMGVAEGSSAIAFCDADGEYAPEELERLIAPILGGDADYVVGSRFTGQIRRMPAHRRLGNLALTQALRWIARTPITDGQSGYRALSAAAAARAEIVHDFNYAQVLTLDLLAKGFRYAEVPISYSFRQTGRSFVRLGRYLRHVIPAVWAELNGPSDRNPRPRSRLTRPAPSPRPEGCSPGRTAPADQA